MTREDFLVAYNIGHRDGKANAYCPNDYDDIFDIQQQPNEDWNAVLDELNRIGRNAFKDDTDYDNLFDFISNLSNVKSQSKEHTEERTETHECDCINRDAGGKRMNEFTKIRDRILARIETYIGDIEFAEEQELTEDEKTIFKSVKDIILEEFDKASSDTEHIIKTTIKEYIDKDYDDVTELLLALSKDLCERIRMEG